MKYPPCITNPTTEQPYPRHEWEIPENASILVKRDKRSGKDIYYYRVRCKRCRFNDPKAPTH